LSHLFAPVFAIFVLAAASVAANGPGDFAAPAGLSGFERPVLPTRSTDLNRSVLRAPAVGTMATALANSVTVQQSGHGNTLILNLEQVNTGTVAAGVLNGSLNLD
jgi:hypothetical protein